MRGCAGGVGPGRRRVPGRPACAGICPTPARSSTSRSSLPRVCGDAPDDSVGAVLDGLSAPRVRGSASRRRTRRGSTHPSPACAGMSALNQCLHPPRPACSAWPTTATWPGASTESRSNLAGFRRGQKTKAPVLLKGADAGAFCACQVGGWTPAGAPACARVNGRTVGARDPLEPRTRFGPPRRARNPLFPAVCSLGTGTQSPPLPRSRNS